MKWKQKQIPSLCMYHRVNGNKLSATFHEKENWHYPTLNNCHLLIVRTKSFSLLSMYFPYSTNRGSILFIYLFLMFPGKPVLNPFKLYRKYNHLRWLNETSLLKGEELRLGFCCFLNQRHLMRTGTLTVRLHKSPLNSTKT